MKTSSLDYKLPDALIAQEPLEPRDTSRLLVLHRETGKLEHRIFREIGRYFTPGDLLVANESRVIPARLYGRKEPTGGKVEVLLLRPLGENEWLGLVGGARTRVGTQIRFYRTQASDRDGPSPSVAASPPSAAASPSPLTAEVVECGERGERRLLFCAPVESYLDDLGIMPLPPYIHRELEDPERYQTIYARTPGSAAAPTAGLHFTPDLMRSLRERGVRFAFVTLHIGLDTFRPIREDIVEAHQIHTEWCRLEPEVAEQINQTRLAGKRVIAVGTTSVRVLETVARQGSDVPGPVVPFAGPTDLYITPGFEFRVVDALITNFHLPRSSLLALVMAFAGVDNIRQAYAEAIARQYRFFSLGDAMLLL